MPVIGPNGQEIDVQLLAEVPVPPESTVTDLQQLVFTYQGALDAVNTGRTVLGSAVPGVHWTGPASDAYLDKVNSLGSNAKLVASGLSNGIQAVNTYITYLKKAIAAANTANNAVHTANDLWVKMITAKGALQTAQAKEDKAGATLNSADATYNSALQNYIIHGGTLAAPPSPTSVSFQIPGSIPFPTALYYNYQSAEAAYYADVKTVSADQAALNNLTSEWQQAYTKAVELINTAQQDAQDAHNKGAKALTAVTDITKASPIPPTTKVASPPGTGSGTTVIGGSPGKSGKGSGTTTIGGGGGGTGGGGTGKESIVQELLALKSKPAALLKAVEQDLGSHKLTGTELFALLMALPVGRATQLLTGLPASSAAWTDISDFTPAQLQKLTTRLAAHDETVTEDGKKTKINDLTAVYKKVPPKDLAKIRDKLSKPSNGHPHGSGSGSGTVVIDPGSGSGSGSGTVVIDPGSGSGSGSGTVVIDPGSGSGTVVIDPGSGSGTVVIDPGSGSGTVVIDAGSGSVTQTIQ